MSLTVRPAKSRSGSSPQVGVSRRGGKRSVDDLARDVRQLDVHSLRRIHEQVERLLVGEPQPSHEDAFGLADAIAVAQRLFHVLR